MKNPRAGTRRRRRFVCGVHDVSGLLSEFEAVRVAIRSEAAQIRTRDHPRHRVCHTQVWIKQTDAKGNVYYFNQDTLESAWFPPCMVCMRLEAKKVCFSCPDAGADGLFYCNECFEKALTQRLH
jgi:hypothetical protein